ncbi:DUF4944 domain-containing protein [Heyndrickxia coagulans]|uniref:DUF4944 domain-containing protein n=1 Tax=Heyndrickxia coagulans TaxID=1398 RepID=UPI000E4B0241|nr:DUF4944 domain-containing protein [Heyndrickxia coagulans]RGR83355.1 DUF4944 domain-containing protein [Heyndrickxia coagulans]
MVAYVNISKYMENKAFARNYPDWAGSSADQDWYAKMSASEPHKEYEGILYWKGSKEEAGRITVKKWFTAGTVRARSPLPMKKNKHGNYSFIDMEERPSEKSHISIQVVWSVDGKEHTDKIVLQKSAD